MNFIEKKDVSEITGTLPLSLLPVQSFVIFPQTSDFIRVIKIYWKTNKMQTNMLQFI